MNRGPESESLPRWRHPLQRCPPTVMTHTRFSSSSSSGSFSLSPGFVQLIFISHSGITNLCPRLLFNPHFLVPGLFVTQTTISALCDLALLALASWSLANSSPQRSLLDPSDRRQTFSPALLHMQPWNVIACLCPIPLPVEALLTHSVIAFIG